MRILHIAVHLGGGVGKAISGIILSAPTNIESNIILVEEPQDYFYVNKLQQNNINVIVDSDSCRICEEMKKYDVTVFNWWGHPLLIKIMLDMPSVRCRTIIWNHVNGCSYPFLNGKFLNGFDGVLFTSEISLTNSFWSTSDRVGILSKSMVVYGMGDFEPNNIPPKKYVNKSEMVIGYAGTINYAKMNHNILDYYEAAIKAINSIKIVMLGNVSKEFMKEVNSRRLEKYFVFPGYVKNVFEYYFQMDVFAYFLNPYSYATTENSLIEAMTVGLPIVVLDNPVEKCIIKENINGVLINNIDEFVSFLKKMKNPCKAAELGESARNYCRKTYSGRINSDKFYRFCMELTKKQFQVKDFSSLLGRTALNGFKMQAEKDAEKFSKLINCQENEKLSILSEIPQIYFEQDKASISQFLRYFPDESIFMFLEGVLKEYAN